MRPDERRGRESPIVRAGAQPVPFDVASDPDAAELEALEIELATAGGRARAERMVANFDRPGPVFAADLRTRLMDRYPAPATFNDRTAPRAERTTASADRKSATPESHGRPRPLGGSVTSRSVGLLPNRRWAVLAVAAALVVVVLGSASGRFFPAPFDARATEAIGATLVRDGAATALTDGTVLRAYDEIRVGADGRATLTLGGSQARLEGGAQVRFDDLSAGRLRVELLAGRTYHRVSPADGGSYIVATGPVTWVALGTAFDLDREPTADGRELVRLLGLQHSVGVAGPDLQTSVGEGRTATVILGNAGPSDLAVGPIDASVLDDPWLVENALLDQALGFPLCVLDRFGLGPTPTPGIAFEPPVTAPTSGPAATPAPNKTGSPKPTARPTPRPTPRATPKPTPKPLPALSLGLTSCDGGVVIDWSAYKGVKFNHYTTLRNTTASIPKAYPPQGGATYLEGSYTTDKSKTSAFDASGEAGGRYYYRAMAFDAADKVIAASSVKSAIAKKVRDLGTLVVGPGGGTKTAFSWNAYQGPGACFTWYKIVYSTDDPTPSIFEGSDYAVASSDEAMTAALAALDPGTYHFRLEVLRYTDLGSPAKFLVAHSDVTTYTVP